MACFISALTRRYSLAWPVRGFHCKSTSVPWPNECVDVLPHRCWSDTFSGPVHNTAMPWWVAGRSIIWPTTCKWASGRPAVHPDASRVPPPVQRPPWRLGNRVTVRDNFPRRTSNWPVRSIPGNVVIDIDNRSAKRREDRILMAVTVPLRPRLVVAQPGGTWKPPRSWIMLY